MAIELAFPLQGFVAVRLLRASPGAWVYEATHSASKEPFVAKVFELDDDSVAARVELEFRLIQQLDLDGVVRTRGLERVGNQLILLLERVPGVDLAEYSRGRQLELGEFMDIAREITRILARVHERKILHRDIKPSNILIDPERRELHLADFGISVLLEQERRRVHSPELLQGTLPYIAPEQTGRMRREVDYRSDLYSLGATFYELLTGRPPFESSVALELVHAHLARRPRPPQQLREGLPIMISELVLRLLEKIPERRYQSARGLLADLDRIAATLAEGHSDAVFELGQRDFAPSLQLPYQLYGRDAELAELEGELIASIEDGAPRLVLLSAEPGLGKTALIESFEAPVIARGGSLAHGRCEHGGTELPYQAFAVALTGLVEQQLTHGDAELVTFREDLSARLGSVASVAVELVPRLSLILGPLEPSPVYEPAQVKARLALAVSRSLGAFAERGPLVLVLDDFCGVDTSSLELLRTLMLTGIGAPLLVVVGCRPAALAQPGELGYEARGLSALLDELRGRGVAIQALELAPLCVDELSRLLADVLGRDPADLGELSALIARKTGGNPLFVCQFLRHAAELGHLWPTHEGWTWDAATLAAAGIPDDISAMMSTKLGQLADEDREVLAVAACVGVSFDLQTIAAVGPARGSALAAALHRLEARGLIDAVGLVHRFVHPGIREAALAQLDGAARRRVHRAVAAQLVEQIGLEAARDDERVYEIVEQLEASCASLDELDEDTRALLLELATAAGQRALRAGAWTVARHHLELAGELLRPDDRRPAAFELRFALAQALALTHARDEASASFDELLRWELSMRDYGRVVARRVGILSLQDQLGAALAVGLDGLARCGYQLPREGSLLSVLRWVIPSWRRVRKLELADLEALPDATDEAACAAMVIATATKNPCFTADAKLFSVLTGFHAALVLRHGFHATAPLALAHLGISVGLGMHQFREAAALCERAVALCERAPEASPRFASRGAALLTVWPLTRPLRELTDELFEVQRLAHEAGDLELAGYAAARGAAFREESGAALGEIIELCERWRPQLSSWGNTEMLVVCEQTLGYAQRLAGVEASAPLRGFEELRAAGHGELMSYAGSSARIVGLWLLGQREAAAQEFACIEAEFVHAGSSRFAAVAAMLATDAYAEADRPTRRRLRARQRRALQLAELTSQHCPANNAAALELIHAERARLAGRPQLAQDHYERARVHAVEHGLRSLEALALERATSLAVERGQEAVAAGLAQLTLAAYRRWGAVAVAERVEQDFAAQLAVLPVAEGAGREATTGKRRSSSDTSALALDLATVLDSIESIGAGLALDELVVRVLRRAIASAGADRGALLLEREGGLGVVARSNGCELDSVGFVAQAVPLPHHARDLPMSAINYVLHTGGVVVVDEVGEDPRFCADPYLVRERVQSLLCMAIHEHGRQIGALVLENSLNTHSFTPARVEILRILVGHAASALDNAQLYGSLERSEARWRSLVQGVPDIIALLDADGRIEFVNRVSRSESSEGWIGQSAELLVAPDDRGAVAAAIREVFATGGHRELEVEGRAGGDGSAGGWYVVRLAPIHVDGQVAKVISIATDVTARKQAEAARAAMEVQLRQQQRLESIGTLAAGVAHEINNPIQGVLNYAELLAMEPDEPALVVEFAGEITAASERVVAIVRNLLAFSRQEQGAELERCAVSTLVNSTLSLIRAVIRKDQIDLRVELARDLPSLRCRAQQLQQILMNLVVNARDALNERYPGSSDQKRIDLRARRLERDGRAWVRISVEDRAGGIPEQLRQRIFDPFFTTKGREQGTGLGLAVSYGIATEHGGELWVESSLGEGSTFHLDLPASSLALVDSSPHGDALGLHPRADPRPRPRYDLRPRPARG